jgi:hypothetical protein
VGQSLAIKVLEVTEYPPLESVTYDLDLVLRVTRYYAERGELDPSVQWEE